MGNYKVALLAATVSAALGACSSGGDSDTTSGKTTNPPVYYIYATDHQGNVNIFSDDGVATIESAGSFQPHNCGAAVALGEVHFTEHKALVVIQSGLKNATCDADTGGGLAIVDLEHQELEEIIHLNRADGKPSRIVHTYMDPEGRHLWLNDDGPSGDVDPDYVFRVNVDSTDTMNMDGDNDDYKNFGDPILVGNGHKKSAFSHMSDTAMAGNYFATHNLSDRTVSIINNPPNGTVATRDLGASNVPHGLDFSPTSGHFYVGITSGVENAVSIIDATDETLPISHIPVGDAMSNGIPAAGYVHTHGAKVYTVGYKAAAVAGDAGHGFLSIIDATNDSVAQVIDIGDVSASSFNISHMEMDHGDEMHVEMKVWIPSRTSGTAINDVIKVVELDPMTGLQKAGTTVSTVTVGVGGDHRNGKITPDGMHAIYPNGGDCGETHDAHGPNCYTISVIDTSTETVIATVETAGHEPGNIGIVSATGVGAGSGGGGHTH